MIIEQRIYTLIPGKAPEYLALYEAEGLAVQSRHLGLPFGYYHTEVGQLNQLTHMWGYVDMNDRTARREALYADPEWQRVVVKLLAMIKRMETSILIPARFALPQPCKLKADI